MNYQETLNYLYQKLPMFQNIGGAAIKFGLKNIQLLCERLGNPQNKFQCIHVAGTNGKGSTSHFLASILQEHSKEKYQQKASENIDKIGLLTSPHLKSFTERIRIDGNEMKEDKIIQFVAENQAFIDEMQPSFFEVTTAMAFWYFAEMNVKIAIIEVGMGGRLDSTNIITPVLAVITNIGYDHQQFLGDTLPLIAGEKAGIIKPKIPVVVSEKHQETTAVFQQKALENDTTIIFAEDILQIESIDFDKLNQEILTVKIKNIIATTPSPSLKERGVLLPFLQGGLSDGHNQQIRTFQSALIGNYQQKNLLGVVCAVDIINELQLLSSKISEESLQKGILNVLKNTHLQGRWQILPRNPLTEPLVVLDTAHNVHGIAVLMENIKHYQQNILQKNAKLHFILGFMKDKDVEKVLSLYPKDANFYFCAPNLERAMSVEILQEKAKNLGIFGEIIPKPADALTQAQANAHPNDMIIVGGSTFVVAEVL